MQFHSGCTAVQSLKTDQPSASSLLLSSLESSDTKVYEPEIRARLGTAAHFCEVVVLKRTSLGTVTALTSGGLKSGGLQGYLAYKKLPPP